MQPTTVLSLAAALVPAVLSQSSTTFHPPGGKGIITVQLDGSTAPYGCLNADGLWNNANDCATFNGDGTGTIGGPSGFCDLTTTSDIYCTGKSIDTAWLGVYMNGNNSAMYLEANVGKSGPSGGNLWYANDIPRTSSIGSTRVTINGKNTTDTQKVYMSWMSKS